MSCELEGLAVGLWEFALTMLSTWERVWVVDVARSGNVVVVQADDSELGVREQAAPHVHGAFGQSTCANGALGDTGSSTTESRQQQRLDRHDGVVVMSACGGDRAHIGVVWGTGIDA